METFEAVLASAVKIRGGIIEEAGGNIKNVQEKQKRDYDRRHLSNTDIRIGDPVLLRNNRRQDRKGGKFTFKWLGPYFCVRYYP